MAGFVLRCLLFGVVASLTVLGLARWNGAPAASQRPPDDGYMAAIIDKHALAERTRAPRIVLIGDSNLAFGIDSELLQDRTSCAVVNMGLHAGLGLSFILNEAADVIRSEDIVVVSTTFFLGATSTPDLIEHTIGLYPPAIAYSPARASGLVPYQISLMLRDLRDVESGFKRLRETIFGVDAGNPGTGEQAADDDPLGIYTRDSFNAFGDVVAHLDATPKAYEDLVGRRTLSVPAQPYDGIAELNDLSAIARTRRARVFYALPPFPETEFRRNESAIIALMEQLEDDLDMTVLGTASSFVFPDERFFDTVYHLDRAGRTERTERLLALLRGSSSAGCMAGGD